MIIQVANGLAASGNHTRIIVPDYAAVSPFELHDKIELVIVKTRGPEIIRRLAYIVYLCLASVKDSDVCFATGYKTPYYLCVSKYIRWSKVALIYMIQHYEPASHAAYRPGFWRVMLPFIAKLAYKLPLRKIAVSNWIRQQIGNEKIGVINNGIDLSKFHPGGGESRESDRFTVGAIASATEWKGFRVFLDAIFQVPPLDLQGITVLVASQAPADQPSNMGINVTRPSNDNELVAFYRACDVFVCSSWIEGFGLPALEAMACGAALITTDCGGVSQYANRQNSLMVPAGDSKAIADSILTLRNNRALTESLRVRGLQTAQNFPLERMTAEYVNLISAV